MLVFAIILMCVTFVGIIIISIVDESDLTSFSFFLGVLFAVGFALILNAGGSTTKKSLKDNTLNIEIHQEFLNGQEISRDTIYIFTPKKKN